MVGVFESHVEEATLHWLAELGYSKIFGPSIAPVPADLTFSLNPEVGSLLGDSGS